MCLQGEIMKGVAEIGFVGAGAMGSALIRGLVSRGRMDPGKIAVSDLKEEALEALERDVGPFKVSPTRELPAMASFLVLAVKPGEVASALEDLAPAMGPHHLLVSIAAGVPTGFLEARLPQGVRVVRAMPNAACLLASGCTALAKGTKATAQDMERASRVFGAVGEVVEVEEKHMDAVTAVSGSGPAYVFLFAEALMEGAARMGLPWNVARILVKSTLMGAARMLKESQEHPAVLKERVCSPGGTTLAGLFALEKGGFRGLVLEAIEEATRRGRELSSELR
jgi:pyrroline-5-carboxylate reductase